MLPCARMYEFVCDIQICVHRTQKVKAGVCVCVCEGGTRVCASMTHDE